MKVAFYSYKGGVGRTKVMVGVGAVMAHKGRRVGMLDFDLDSSGLAAIFGINPDAIDGGELLHILRAGEAARIPEAMLDVLSLVVKRFGDPISIDSSLKYLPTIANPVLSDCIDLSQLTVFLNTLIETTHLNCGVDIVLIDLKPGYSPSYKYVLPEVDRVVVVTRLDKQNIIGLSQLFPQLERSGQHPILIANMIPDSPKVPEYKEALETACNHPIDVCIPYMPDLLFDNDFECIALESSVVRESIIQLVNLLMQYSSPAKSRLNES